MISRKLTYFLKVCELGGLSNAAEALFVSQQALSKAIDNLEEELGVPLFVRSPRGLKLTRYGEVLREEAWDLKKREERMAARLSSLKDDVHNSVSMSFFSGMMSQYPEGFFEDFMAERPETRFFFYSYYDDANGRRFANTDVDLFFSTCPMQLNDMELAYEIKAPLDLLVSKDHPLASRGCATLEDLRGDRFIVTNAGLDSRNHVQKLLGEHGIQIDHVLSDAEDPLIRYLVHARKAVSFFAGPDDMLPEGTARVHLNDHPILWTSYYYVRRMGLPPVARQLLDAVIAFRSGSMSVECIGAKPAKTLRAFPREGTDDRRND